MEYYGYVGKILYVDLTTGQIKTEPLDMEVAKKYLGGMGHSLKTAYDILKPGTAPLSPDNPIVISAGPLIGTLTPSSSKIDLVTKSATPANKEQTKNYVRFGTGGGNRFGFMMKNAGYDQIVITGRAKKPVYLKIINGDIEICNADDLWGKKDIYETTDELTNRYKNSGVYAIGKPGENLVESATGYLDKKNTMGKSGGAAVMGSKNLKAIVVYGTKGVKVHNPKRLMTLAKRQVERDRKLPYFTRPDTFAPWDAPLSRASSEWAALYPDELRENTLFGRTACFSCNLACKFCQEIKSGRFAGTIWHHAGITLVPAVGVSFGLKDYRDSMKFNQLLNSQGFELTTMLAMIAFVISLYERGVITKKDTGGLELKMGDIDVIIKLLQKVANREDIGDAMARGWYSLCQRVGVDAEVDGAGIAICKGTSLLPDARRPSIDFGIDDAYSLGPITLGIIVNPGAHHIYGITYDHNPSMDVAEYCRGLVVPRETIDRIASTDKFNIGRFQAYIEDGEAVYNSLGVCNTESRFGLNSVREYSEYYSAVTGVQMSPEELKKAGERVWNLYKLINVREGFTRADDKCPEAWIKAIKPAEETEEEEGKPWLRDYFGNLITSRADIEKMIDEYYDERGWDINTSVPTRNKLEELELEEFADSLRIR